MKKTDRYAYRTRLGWCIGDIDNSDNMRTDSNFIKVNFTRNCWPAKSSISGKESSVSFSIDEQSNGHQIERALKEEWNKDIQETNGEMIGLSNEDRKFLQIMKNNIKYIDGHYQVPLPFRDDIPNLPCNRDYALKRADGIKRKM